MLEIREESCVLCGTCVKDCFMNALKIRKNKKIEWIDEMCVRCGHCVAVCPKKAIVIDGDGYEAGTVESFGNEVQITPEEMRKHIMMRRSIRYFSENEVSEKDLELILEAGKYSPTGCNSQGNVFLVVKSEEGKREFVKEMYDTLEKMSMDVLDGKSTQFPVFMAEHLLATTISDYKNKLSETITYNAPVIIVIFSNISEDGPLAGAAMTDMAIALGLGTCYVKLITDAFSESSLFEKYGIPKEKVPSMALILGKPKHKYLRSVPRLTPETIIV